MGQGAEAGRAMISRPRRRLGNDEAANDGRWQLVSLSEASNHYQPINPFTRPASAFFLRSQLVGPVIIWSECLFALHVLQRAGWL